MIIAGLEFFPRKSTSDYARLLATEEDSSYATYDEKSSPNHLPIELILGGGWLLLAFLGIRIIYFFPKNGDHKKRYVQSITLVLPSFH